MIREVKMKKEPAFTEEQVNILAENKYTYRVSEHSLKFTAEFFRDACRARAKRISYRQFLEEHGYDPEMLGRRRIYHIGETIKGKTPGDFPDDRPVKSKLIHFDEKSDKRAMKQMQHEILYMKQEIEFLKKIMASGFNGSEDEED